MLMRLCLFAIMLSSSALNAAAGCERNAKGAEVCGTGDEAITVLPETKSPSGRLAIGWRVAKGTPPTELPDVGRVEEYIVRLTDGAVLGLAIGRAWNNGEMQSNKIDMVTAWSPDERWLIACDVGQESLVDFAVYAFDASAGGVVEKNLLEQLKKAAAPKLMARVGKEQFEQYELQIPYPPKITVNNAGKVTLPFEYHIPKQDERFDLVATFTLSQKNGTLDATKIAVRSE